MTKFWRIKRFKLGSQRGFTLIELMIVIAIIGILAAIALPLYANMQSRARIARAQADVRTLAAAVNAYSMHMGALPAALDNLTASVNNNEGLAAGPFMRTIPVPPTGWGAAYTYTSAANGTYTVSAAGDSTSFTSP